MTTNPSGFLSSERRDDIRIHTKAPIFLSFLNPNTAKIVQCEGTMLNLSSLGLTFSCPISLNNIVVADFEIKFPQIASKVTFKGWIIWEDLKKGVYGIRFIEVNDTVKNIIGEYLAKSVSGKLVILDRRRKERRHVSKDLNGQDRRKDSRRNRPGRSKNQISLASFDRRHLIRIQSNLKGYVHLQDLPLRYPARMISLSERGTSLITNQVACQNVPELIIELDLPKIPNSHLTLVIQWQREDEDGCILGGYFRDLHPEQTQALRSYLQDPLQNRQQLRDRRLVSPIVSDLIYYKNRVGKTIVAYHDHRAISDYQADSLLIIPSAYGETKKDAIHISYYLVMNGFQVIRYDNTDHTGESEGDILDITLNKMKEDILATCDYVEKMLGTSKVGLVALSLAARTALKAVAQDKRIVFFLGLVTAVDLRYTLNAVYCEDLVGTYQNGKIWGITNVLGHNTKLDLVLQDALDNGYHNLETTLEDAKKISVPVVLLSAEKDPWVRFEDVQKVLQVLRSPKKEIHVVPALHQLKEDPNAARACFQIIAASARKFMCNKDASPRDVKEPSLRELAIQNKLERQRARTSVAFEKNEEQKFWKQYLDKFHFINELPDYKNLMQFLYKSIHEIHPGEAILDAGCGNGTFGLWVLWYLAWLAQKSHHAITDNQSLPSRYVSLDFIPHALQECKVNQQSLAKELFSSKPMLNLEYRLSDLNDRLPFADGEFNKLVSNLVISYVRDPLFTIKEMFRVVKPGGFLVITTLKSYADTSEIYRNYVLGNEDQSRIEETRRLLINAGKIKEKETEGQFTFFSEEELLGLAKQANAADVQVVRCFANQANALIIHK